MPWLLPEELNVRSKGCKRGREGKAEVAEESRLRCSAQGAKRETGAQVHVLGVGRSTDALERCRGALEAWCSLLKGR